jgi:hypothetical protein
MYRVARGRDRFPASLLVLFLLVQAGLLFPRLNLLPVWGDEQFTLDVMQRPWGEIPSILWDDIHPPLYYFLVKAWANLPLGQPEVAQARAFSALFALLSTPLLYVLWLRQRPPAFGTWFLALWTLSPTLLLYSRMARSYSLQLFVGILAVYAASVFLKQPADRRRLARYAAAAALVLYVHYLPGLAIAGATALLLALRCRRERSAFLWKRWFAVNGLIGLLYLPWLATLGQALTRVSGAEPYFLVENFALETGIKLAYWFTSFTYGEAFSGWAVKLGLILAPGVIWLLWQGLRPAPKWFPLVATTAGIGYLGAAAWVSFPFMGARLLFLLPFYLRCLVRGRLRGRAAGSVILGGVLVVQAAGLSSYFRKTGFLNQGYLVPFEEIALRIEERSAGQPALLLVDGYNTDPAPLLARLEGRVDVIKIRGEEAARQARERIERGDPGIIWFLRNTHDISPDGVVSALQDNVAGSYGSQHSYFVPYSEADEYAAEWLGWPAQTRYHYQLTEFRHVPANLATPDGPTGR